MTKLRRYQLLWLSAGRDHRCRLLTTRGLAAGVDPDALDSGGSHRRGRARVPERGRQSTPGLDRTGVCAEPRLSEDSGRTATPPG